MAFNFPPSPAAGQEFSPVPGVTYVYYAPRWLVKPSPGGGGGGGDATIAYVDSQDALRVLKAGDTMTGDLTISKVNPFFTLNKQVAGQSNRVIGKSNGVDRWSLILGSNVGETGGDVGSKFVLNSHNDAGSTNNTVMSAERNTGVVNFSATPTVNGTPIAGGAGISAIAIKLGPPTADAVMFGDGLNPKCGQTFIAAGNTIGSIAGIDLMYIGSLVDDVIVRVYSLNTSRNPTTQVGVDSSSIGAGMSNASFTSYTATFATPVPVTPGVEYAFVLERTGAVSGSNRFFAHVSNLPTYSKGNYITYNGTVWSHVYYQDVPVTINFVGDVNSLATYIGPGDASKVNRHGDNLTGFLTLHANPTSGSHAANKTYADLKVPIAGGFMNGNLQVPKLTVENSTLPIVALHQGGNPKWVVAGDTAEFSISSDDFGTVAKPLAINYTTGAVNLIAPLTLPAGYPTAPLHAVHKQYVDEAIANALAVMLGTANELRFTRTSSQRMTRLYGTTSSLAWTLSMWVKRVGLGTRQSLFGIESTTGTGKIHIEFEASNSLSMYAGAAGDTALAVGPVYNSTTLWYHIVWSVPSGAPTSPKFHNLYVNNGSAMTGIIAGNDLNTAVTHYIGQPLGYPDVIMKDVVFVDGSALTPTAFGEDVAGTWTPKVYTGPFGTNGFKLNFKTGDLGKDITGNANHWTPVNFP